MRRQNLLFALLGVTGLAATVAASRRMGDDYKFFDEIIEVKHIISSRYVETPDEKMLRQGAIQGMVEALNDPYTVYVPSSDKEVFNKDLTGEYAGIGAQVNMQEGWLTIVSPLEDSPAFRAGLMADDRIVSVGGVSTQDKNINDCVDMLMGQAGTPVELVVERKGRKFDLSIVRDRIKTRSVKGFHRSEGDASQWNHLIDAPRAIGYIRLTQFTPKCSEEVLAALRAMGADTGSLKGLVLDLRFNPGGLLNEAEAIADLFLTDGVIVSTKGRAYPEKVTRAKGPGTLPDFPITVLVNGSSASASEVLAGALAENSRAKVVGTRSFGKGSVQSVLELPSGNGSEIKITEQGYLLPSGRSITRKDDADQWGVDPSEGFYVPMTDAQTVAMLETRRREEVLRYAEEQAGAASDATATPSPQTAPTQQASRQASEQVDWNNVDSVLAFLKDPQLTAAVKALQIKVDSGEWKPTGETHNPKGRIAGDEMLKLTQYQQRLLRELARTDRRLEALETAAGDEAPKAADLWANDLDLTGGLLEIRDKQGNVIARLDITGNNLERWLLDADVRKREDVVK
jgi:carboxyl-terminal processing protease